MYRVFEVDEDLKKIHQVCIIKTKDEILDAVIKAYSDGNYNSYENFNDDILLHCYRDNGTSFDLMAEKI